MGPATAWPTRVVLRDGAEVQIRRLTPADAPLLADAFSRLSEESRRFRFLGPKHSLSQSELRYLTEVDGICHEGIGAVDSLTGRCVAIGRFVRDPSDHSRAEVALTVADEWQHRGLGKLMLEELADRARRQKIRRFTAFVAADNTNTQRLLGQIKARAQISSLGANVAEYRIELGQQGLGTRDQET